MTKERQARKQEEIRALILSTAKEIIGEEGVEKLSIRKIASKMEYSPAIIYHYFKDKSEITGQILGDGYRQILQAVQTFQPGNVGLVKQIRSSLENYIRVALSFPEEYKAFMLSSDTAVLEKTGILEQGITGKRQTLRMLADRLQQGMDEGILEKQDPELTAQILWASTFGLITRLTVEKGVSKEQVDRLIDHHFNVLFKGIEKK